MANSLIIAAYPTGLASTANTTQFWYVSGWNVVALSSETNAQIIFRSGGTLKNFYLRLSANSVSATTTFQTRDNAVNGNQVISVATTVTGEFEDTSNTDTITAGDKICVTSVPAGGSTGTFTMTVNCFLFAATTNTVTRLASTMSSSFTGASTTYFHVVQGVTTSLNTNEATAKCRQRKAGTMQNLGINVSVNTRSDSTTFNGRLNGSNGALTLSLANATTGFVEDTTHSDTIAVGDDYNTSFVTGGGTGALTPRHIALDFVSTANFTEMVAGVSQGLAYSLNTTSENSLGGRMSATITTDTQTQTKARAAWTFVELSINVTTNGSLTNDTLTFRKNGANGNLSVSITASTTGVFSDSSNSDVLVTTDEVNTQLVTVVSAGITAGSISVWASLPSAVTAKGFARAFGSDTPSLGVEAPVFG